MGHISKQDFLAHALRVLCTLQNHSTIILHCSHTYHETSWLHACMYIYFCYLDAVTLFPRTMASVPLPITTLQLIWGRVYSVVTVAAWHHSVRCNTMNMYVYSQWLECSCVTCHGKHASLASDGVHAHMFTNEGLFAVTKCINSSSIFCTCIANTL